MAGKIGIRSARNATLVGLSAVLLWSLVVGLIRTVSVQFGATGGAALIYSLACLLLVSTVGWPDIRRFPRPYLIVGSLLFVSYELCLSLSIGYAGNSQQAIEVGMVNYLWPTFTLVAAILFNGQRANGWIIPGIALSMIGICWVLAGDRGIDPAAIMANIRQNPLSYGLAFVGALIWAAYSVVTARHAQGRNGITLFFALTAGALWIKFLAGGEPALVFTLPSLLPLALASAAMAFGYAAWNFGVLHGNMTVLAGASYFVPVLSAAFAAMVLVTPLSLPFWQGTVMVCAGSIVCWLATRAGRQQKL